MKVRKLAVALALVGGLGSNMANALGLGDAELQSYLNERLDARIALREANDVSPDEVLVDLAPSAAFQRVGIERSFFLNNLQFSVSTAPDGQLVIDVSSDEPVREPYLNFLVEVTWPNGRLLREYSLLIDPPTYAEESGADTSVAPAQTAQQTRQEPQRSEESRRRERAVRGDVDTSTADNSDVTAVPREYGPTDASDTLWGIAQQVRAGTGYTTQQTMMALQDLNPNAFMGNNINRLKRGQVLRIPTQEQIGRRSAAEASRQVVAQNEALQQPEQQIDATGQQPQAPADTAESGEAELKLVAGDGSDASAPDDGSAAGSAGATEGAADTGSGAIAQEELDRLRRDNEELNSRMKDLEDQVDTLQRLIELKNNQLARMQQDGQGEGEAPAPDANTGDAAETMTEAGTADDAKSAPAGDDQVAAMEPGAESGMDGSTGTDTTGEQAADTEESMTADDEMTPAEPSSDMAASGTDEVASEDASDEITSDETSSDEGGMAESGSDDMPVAAGESSGTNGGDGSDASPDDSASAEPAAPAQEEPQRSTVQELIHQVKNNPAYQIGLGGGVIALLAILGLVARRNANREKAFYEELNRDSEADDEPLSLGDDEGSSEGGDAHDALSEADGYASFGRYDQAAEVLEGAISREPSRTDLRLKLLAIYADAGNREAFEKQFSELRTLEEDDATEEARALEGRLREAEDTPSIDDLESQLRSGASASGEAESSDDDFDFSDTFSNLDTNRADTDDASDAASDTTDDVADQLDVDSLDVDEPESDETEEDTSNDPDAPIEYDLSSLDLEGDGSEAAEALEETDDSLESSDKDLEEDLSVDFDLPSDDTSTEADQQADDSDADTASLEDELGDLELDESLLDDSAEASDESQDASSTSGGDAEEPLLDEDLDLSGGEDEAPDESFLDDLDAELDKVASEDDPTGDAGSDDNTTEDMDDLELDISDDDLAVMEEVSGAESSDSDTTTESSAEDDQAGADDDDASGPQQTDDDIPVAADTADDTDQETNTSPGTESTDDGGADLSGEDLEDDEFDFLSGTDESATKLDLARAYVEMGDADGAREILEEVSLEGNDEQKAEAQELLKNLS